MDSKTCKKKYDALISVRIDITPIHGHTEVVLFKNTKTTSGLMGIKTSTKDLIGKTMLSYIHILCEIYSDFLPVIRFANEENEEVMTLIVFNFDRKHLKYIKDKAKRLSFIYHAKHKVSIIDFSENYSKVMITKKI